MSFCFIYCYFCLRASNANQRARNANDDWSPLIMFNVHSVLSRSCALRCGESRVVVVVVVVYTCCTCCWRDRETKRMDEIQVTFAIVFFQLPTSTHTIFNYYFHNIYHYYYCSDYYCSCELYETVYEYFPMTFILVPVDKL